ncbi:unnamed protein product [Camellia sinensis]
MAKEFNVPPVVFPSGGTPASFATAAAFDGTTSFLAPQFGGNISGIETGLDDKPPLLKKFGINTRQIWSKTVSIVNPFRVNTNLQEYSNLSDQEKLSDEEPRSLEQNLKALDELVSAIQEWTPMAGDKPVATCLHRADDLLQQSMFRLDDEFRLEDEARDGEEDAGTASEEAVGGGGVTGGLLVVEGDESNAESIVVLVLENRSFDHMIGWMKNSINPSINGVTGKECNPVSTKDQDQPQTQSICFKDDAEFMDPDPGHSFESVEQQVFGSGPIPSMTGFVEQALSMSQNLTETNLSVIEPRYFDIKGLPANDDHPSHDVANGQKLVKEVYETLRASPQWNETLVLKLMHEKTKVQLHSHEVPYGSGSGQQSVTGFSVVDDSNSYWVLSISLSHFQGKVTIVTTSTQGIGSSIAKHLGFANRFKDVDKAVEKLKPRGIEVFGVVCHVFVAQQRKNMVERLFRI